MNSHVLNGMVALLAFGVALSAYAAGDPAKGKAAYEICAVCHGASGEGTPELNVPKIGGQEEWYVARQLQNFNSGLRAPTTSGSWISVPTRQEGSCRSRTFRSASIDPNEALST